MRKVKKQLALTAKNVRYTLKPFKLKTKYIHRNVAYFSQWESKDLVEPIITKQISADTDPLWRESGATSPQEYVEWSWIGCGMACLKMILATLKHQNIPLVVLGQRSLEYGVYKIPLGSTGMLYKPFVSYIANNYGLRGVSKSSLTIPEIKRALGNGGFVIASVSPEIRFPKKIPTNKGGHLVLVFGYDDNAKTIILNNPSGFSGTQERVEMPEKAFGKFFDNKGVIVFGENL